MQSLSFLWHCSRIKAYFVCRLFGTPECRTAPQTQDLAAHWCSIRIYVNILLRHTRMPSRVEHVTSYVCARARYRLIRPVFFSERTGITGNYLDMLRLLVLPQINDENVIFQQNGAPAHYANLVRLSLMRHFYRAGLGKNIETMASTVYGMNINGIYF